ncbi:MAG: transglycosylase SLT domain-containing protein, partial [Pseudomonadales bacterium]
MSVKAINKTAPSTLAVLALYALALWHTGARAETSVTLSIADAFAAYGSSTLSRSSKRKLAGSEDLWRAVPAYFQLTLEPKRARVAHERAQLLSNPNFIRNASTRARPYLHFIVQRIAERDMPGELALLPIVESGYNPFARSHAGAQGPWQFIASTGDHYGLARNWWYDGRGDIIASTKAALDYLQHLADRFDGDWLLALAAYNCG